MRVFGIHGSPRAGGNSDTLLDEALAAARAAGAEVDRVYCRQLKMQGCLACGGCEKTGECVLKDDMTGIYSRLDQAQAVILAAPMFFYNLPAMAKALVDRAQARWSRRALQKPREEWKHHGAGKGYVIGVGATRGKNLFEGYNLVAKYFFDALDKDFAGGVYGWRLEGKAQAAENPELLAQARRLGQAAAKLLDFPKEA